MNRRALIASLEKDLRKEAFLGKSFTRDFETFVKRFADFAVKADDASLAKFADKLLSYPDFMREVNPVELASHLLRNTKTKKTPYRGSVPAENIVHSLLGTVAARVKAASEIDPKFAAFASGFFSEAAMAAR